MSVVIEPFVPTAHHSLIVQLWQEADGGQLPFSPRLVAHALSHPSGARSGGALAKQNGEPVGFVLVQGQDLQSQNLQSQDLQTQPPKGRLLALGVSKEHQRKGIGQSLLAWAEEWLAAAQCKTVGVGGGFFPGVPMEAHLAESSDPLAFWTRVGYGVGASQSSSQSLSQTVDIARTIGDYVPPSGVAQVPCQVSPARPNQRERILHFCQEASAANPDSSAADVALFLAEGGRIADFMLLWTETGLSGLCQLVPEDSVYPIEGYYPYHLPKPWAAIRAPIIHAPIRAPIMNALDHPKAYPIALLDAGLRRLHNMGVNGVVMRLPAGQMGRLTDVTDTLGFTPLRRYQQLHKSLRKADA